MDYVLGLDLGCSSVGWAVLEQNNGRPVSLADLRGKTVVLNFLYARCRDSCEGRDNHRVEEDREEERRAVQQHREPGPDEGERRYLARAVRVKDCADYRFM